ncbi:MAG: hypothetical protein U1F87_09095 [Kiritimatiellia bacterium]
MRKAKACMDSEVPRFAPMTTGRTASVISPAFTKPTSITTVGPLCARKPSSAHSIAAHAAWVADPSSARFVPRGQAQAPPTLLLCRTAGASLPATWEMGRKQLTSTLTRF